MPDAKTTAKNKAEIVKREVPSDALTYVFIADGAFVDCYTVDIPKTVSLTQYIEAFYTTPLFKVERNILSLISRKWATDSQAVELALGNISEYSFWIVKKRIEDQILLSDYTEKTSSWLKVEPIMLDGKPATRLYFGSVVMPKEVSENGEGKLGFLFDLLGGFHKVYSRALLTATFNKLLSR